MEVGNSLRRAIDKGLRNSKYGIVVLSNFFFNKEWPQKELDALFEKVSDEDDIILPLWHKISKDEVRHYSHTISGIAALNTSVLTTDEIAKKIAGKVLSRNIKAQEIK